MSMGSGCCGGDCGCGPCSQANSGVSGILAGLGLGEHMHPMYAHSSSPMHMMGMGQTITTPPGVATPAAGLLGSLELQLSTLWNDLQQTKIAGVGLGFILVGVVVAMHFKKR